MSRIIICDVDDVVADLCPAWVQSFRETAPSCPDPLENKVWDTWDMISRIPTEHHDLVWSSLNHDLYDYKVQPIPGALDGVNILRYLGFRVIFATSCAVNHAGAKLRWLHRHGFVSTVHYQPDYVEISDKSLLRGEAMIDDRPKTLRMAKDRDSRMVTILLRRHFTDNHLPGMGINHRVSNWTEVVSAIRTEFVE